MIWACSSTCQRWPEGFWVALEAAEMVCRCPKLSFEVKKGVGQIVEGLEMLRGMQELPYHSHENTPLLQTDTVWLHLGCSNQCQETLPARSGTGSHTRCHTSGRRRTDKT